MTLNSHLQRQDRVVVARSVLMDEVAEAGETLHAAVTWRFSAGRSTGSSLPFPPASR